MVQPHWKMTWKFLITLCMHCDPTISLSVIYPKEIKIHIHTHSDLYKVVYISATHNNKNLEAIQMLISRLYLIKALCIFIVEAYLSIKNN